MLKRLLSVLLCTAVLLSMSGCGAEKKELEAKAAQEKLAQSFRTTAKMSYKGLQTEIEIYKKPMNCAVVTFGAPDSLKDMKLTFYTDHVTMSYKEQEFDFVPDSLPGKAASKLVISAINAAMSDEGVSVEQTEDQLIIKGSIEEGDFLLTIDAKNGNILKLSIPQSELELEILNFKILE